MASIKNIQEVTRFSMDTLETIKGKAEQIFENNSAVAEVVMMDGNLKSEIYTIYELLDIVGTTISTLAAMNLSNTGPSKPE